MVVADRCLCMYEESGIRICVLKTAFQDVLQADAQAEGIILQPAFLHDKSQIICI